MNTYISMLRGINVSGQKKIKMADLKTLYQDLGFEQVTTYIQSGNVIFKSDVAAATLADKIKQAILDHYGYEVKIFIKTINDFEQVIANNPFLKREGTDPKTLLSCFLQSLPNPEKVQATEQLDFSPDEFIIQNDIVYIHCPNGFGRAKINNNFFEKKLAVGATTRNWRSTLKLLAIALATRAN